MSNRERKLAAKSQFVTRLPSALPPLHHLHKKVGVFGAHSIQPQITHNIASPFYTPLRLQAQSKRPLLNRMRVGTNMAVMDSPWDSDEDDDWGIEDNADDDATVDEDVEDVLSGSSGPAPNDPTGAVSTPTASTSAQVALTRDPLRKPTPKRFWDIQYLPLAFTVMFATIVGIPGTPVYLQRLGASHTLVGLTVAALPAGAVVGQVCQIAIISREKKHADAVAIVLHVFVLAGSLLSWLAIRTASFESLVVGRLLIGLAGGTQLTMSKYEQIFMYEQRRQIQSTISKYMQYAILFGFFGAMFCTALQTKRDEPVDSLSLIAIPFNALRRCHRLHLKVLLCAAIVCF